MDPLDKDEEENRGMDLDWETMSRVTDLEILECNLSSPPRMRMVVHPLPSPINPFSPPPMAGIDLSVDGPPLSHRMSSQSPTPEEKLAVNVKGFEVDNIDDKADADTQVINPNPEQQTSTVTQFVEEITILSDTEESEINESLEVIAIVPMVLNGSFKKKKSYPDVAFVQEVKRGALGEEITVLSSGTESEVGMTDMTAGKNGGAVANPGPCKNKKKSPIPWEIAPKANSRVRSKDETENPPEMAAQPREELKDQKILQLEQLMNVIMKQIKKLDEEEVDWDEEHEKKSSYMERYKLINRYIKNYNLICELKGCSKNTGRHIQRSITLKKVTEYPLLDKAVENFVNKNGFFKGTDYSDILNIVDQECNFHLKLGLPDKELQDLAKKLHVKVITRKQYRRKKDVLLVMPDITNAVDPADTSPELEAKLLENAKKARSIRSVAEKYVKKAKRINDDVDPADKEELTDEELDHSRREFNYKNDDTEDDSEDDSDDDTEDDTDSEESSPENNVNPPAAKRLKS